MARPQGRRIRDGAAPGPGKHRPGVSGASGAAGLRQDRRAANRALDSRTRDEVQTSSSTTHYGTRMERARLQGEEPLAGLGAGGPSPITPAGRGWSVRSRPATSPEPRRPRSSMCARPRSSWPWDRSRKGVPQRSPAPTSIRGVEPTFPKELLPELVCTSSRVRESGAYIDRGFLISYVRSQYLWPVAGG
jgi:hypothetical protein